MLGVLLMLLGTIAIGAALILRIVHSKMSGLFDKIPGALENLVKMGDPAMAKTLSRLKLLPRVILGCFIGGGIAAVVGLVLVLWPGTHFAYPLTGLLLCGIAAAMLVVMSRIVKNQFSNMFQPQTLMNAALQSKQKAFGVPNSSKNPSKAKRVVVEPPKQKQPATLRDALQQARQQSQKPKKK